MTESRLWSSYQKEPWLWLTLLDHTINDQIVKTVITWTLRFETNKVTYRRGSHRKYFRRYVRGVGCVRVRVLVYGVIAVVGSCNYKSILICKAWGPCVTRVSMTMRGRVACWSARPLKCSCFKTRTLLSFQWMSDNKIYNWEVVFKRSLLQRKRIGEGLVKIPPACCCTLQFSWIFQVR